MKKVLVLLVALVMLFSFSVTSLAAGSFLKSPSGNKAPEVVESENESDDCDGRVVVTPYSERDKLDDEQRKNIEKAYEIISSTDDLTELNDDLKKLAEDKDIDGKDLAVSDLFNVDDEGCVEHDDHGDYIITLDSEVFDNFVGLLEFDGEGWKLVEGAKIVDGKLVFKSDVPTNYAVVVNTGAGNISQTGDSSRIYIWTMIFAGSAFAVVVLLTLKKKSV